MNRQTFVSALSQLVNAYDSDMDLCNALINLWRVKHPRARLTGSAYDAATRAIVPWRVSQKAVKEWIANGRSEGSINFMLGR